MSLKDAARSRNRFMAAEGSGLSARPARSSSSATLKSGVRAPQSNEKRLENVIFLLKKYTHEIKIGESNR